MSSDTMTTVYRCGAAYDAAGVSLREATIAVRGGVIVEATDGDRVVELPDRVVLPAMVNSHAHLNLTHIGPQPYGGDFATWIGMVRGYGPGNVAPGAAASREAGVFAVGDICTSPHEAAVGCGDSGGVSFIEYFGIGSPWVEEALSRMAAQRGHGLQPHAPYSAGPAVFEAACGSTLPCSTHLAETHDEARFVAKGDGPFRDLLKRIGKWDDAFARWYSDGLSPVQWMKPYLARKRWLLAHCNYVDDADIDTLAQTGASVAYCPIASEYFGHGEHRYRDMLEAGVNVCLGTDSIVCQPKDVEQPLSILNQMRRLHQRDGTHPGLLLAMATTHGCRALGLDESEATLAAGSRARLMAVRFDPDGADDPLTQVLRSRYPVEVIV